MEHLVHPNVEIVDGIKEKYIVSICLLLYSMFKAVNTKGNKYY